MAEPIACQFCGAQPGIRQRDIARIAPGGSGDYSMYRTECECGAVGKWRPSREAAIATWNAPYQVRAAGETLTEAGG